MKVTKTTSGRNHSYLVREEASGVVKCEIISTRDYVACTSDGLKWFTDRELAEKEAKRRTILFVEE